MTPYPRPFAGRRVVTDIANVAIGADGEEQLHHLAVSAARRQVQWCDVVADGGIDVGTAIDEQSSYYGFAPNCRLVEQRSSDPRRGADNGGESTIPAHFCESEPRRESSAVEASGLRRKFKRPHDARGRAYSVDGTLGTG